MKNLMETIIAVLAIMVFFKIGIWLLVRGLGGKSAAATYNRATNAVAQKIFSVAKATLKRHWKFFLGMIFGALFVLWFTGYLQIEIR